MSWAALYLLVSGGDGYEAKIVTAAELDEAYVGLHFSPASSCPDDERKAMLEHLHDEDNWELNHELGRVRYGQSYEDGYVEVVRLIHGVSERAADLRAINEIADERFRQIYREGYDSRHDDDHPCGELALAGAAYALEAAIIQNPNQESYGTEPPDCWPWDASEWKPKDARRNLVRAAALFCAEIARFDREELRKAKGQA